MIGGAAPPSCDFARGVGELLWASVDSSQNLQLIKRGSDLHRNARVMSITCEAGLLDLDLRTRDSKPK